MRDPAKRRASNKRAWAKWYAKHRDSEIARVRAYYRTHEQKRYPPPVIPDVPIEHPILDQAREIVGPTTTWQGRLRYEGEMLQEELVATAALALVERKPVALVRQIVRQVRVAELRWRLATTWLDEEAAA